MRIGIDARWIFPQVSGIGTYTRELIRELAALDRQNEYVLFFQDARIADDVTGAARLSDAPNFSTRLLDYGVFSPAGQARFPAELRGLNLDVFHSPNYMLPLFAFPKGRPGDLRCVVTIHDVIPLLFPDHAPRSRKTRMFPVYRWLMQQVGARADVIVTVSESSRRDVLEQLHIGPERAGAVMVVPNGVAPEYVPAAKEPRAAKTILYVGRFDPYKNACGLMDVFAAVRKKTKTEVRLRMVGPPDPRYPEARQRAESLGLNPFIDWVGYVDGAALIREYQQADVFVLLSKYEGFGLPVLEAMACGTPVVCSNRSSLPEVAADAAAVVDPDRVEDAAAAIVRVLDEPAHAADLSRRGLQRAAAFTWKRTAEQTIKAYDLARRV
ncbi:MAG TPA: glycosyltransferase family 1 protein [Kiritimatiellia bacterium]|nr:glycosyltransferase family 1 protein [Kiritimatiellia bacterium]